MNSGQQQAKAAVFLDRDGTLIHDRGYLRHPSEVVFYKDSIPALRMLQDHVELFIVTNQSGVARGLQTIEEVEKVNQYVLNFLSDEGIHIRAVYTCPHHREAHCACSKPNPFFALKAAADFGISPEYAFSVGDHPHDVEMARRFGGIGIYVLTGHGEKHRADLHDDALIANSIFEAAEMILTRVRTPPASYITAASAARLIREGGVAAIPTETVYGMGANALNESAVQRIFEIKKRPTLDPLIVHIANANDLPSVAAEIPEAAQKLTQAFWPGPLTLVLPKQCCIPDLVTSSLNTVAVRVPIHPLAQKIIREAGCPVAAPSANLFGTISPTCARHVYEQFGNSIEGIVDGGPCAVGVESTIIGFWSNRAWLLRPGGISLEQIEAEIGPVEIYKKTGPDDIRAPGTLPRHYSPTTPLFITNPQFVACIPGNIGHLVFGPDAPSAGMYVENLSPSGNLEEAAANLYAALRRLDHAGLDQIMADLLPDNGLGRTINDRLRRAANH